MPAHPGFTFHREKELSAAVIAFLTLPAMGIQGWLREKSITPWKAKSQVFLFLLYCGFCFPLWSPIQVLTNAWPCLVYERLTRWKSIAENFLSIFIFCKGEKNQHKPLTSKDTSCLLLIKWSLFLFIEVDWIGLALVLPANGSCVHSPVIYEVNNIHSTSIMQSRTSILLVGNQGAVGKGDNAINLQALRTP